MVNLNFSILSSIKKNISSIKSLNHIRISSPVKERFNSFFTFKISYITIEASNSIISTPSSTSNMFLTNTITIIFKHICNLISFTLTNTCYFHCTIISKNKFLIAINIIIIKK